MCRRTYTGYSYGVGRGRGSPKIGAQSEETFPTFHWLRTTDQEVHVCAGRSDVQRPAARPLGVDRTLQRTVGNRCSLLSAGPAMNWLTTRLSLSLWPMSVNLEHLRLPLRSLPPLHSKDGALGGHLPEVVRRRQSRGVGVEAGRAPAVPPPHPTPQLRTHSTPSVQQCARLDTPLPATTLLLG